MVVVGGVAGVGVVDAAVAGVVGGIGVDAAVVAGGSNPASTTTESVEAITNVRDAWAAAKRQLGAEL